MTGAAVRALGLALGLLVSLAHAQSPAMVAVGTSHPSAVAHYRVQGDGIEQALNGLRGDASSGQRIVHDRQVGLCGLCHTFGASTHTALGGDLAGVGSRLSAAQLRLRMVDSQALNPRSIMPAFHRLPTGMRVAAAYAAQPILQAQQVEDVVAYLQTLK